MAFLPDGRILVTEREGRLRLIRDGVLDPEPVAGVPEVGLTFYTGDRFPNWQGNLFVGGMMTGRVPQTGHLERILLNQYGEEVRREWLLTELKQRIRDVRQGPDGFLYVLTEENEAVLLRIEPVEP